MDSLKLLIAYARVGKLVSCSIHLEPTGQGRYSFNLIDGTAEVDAFDTTDADYETPATAPGKKGQPE